MEGRARVQERPAPDRGGRPRPVGHPARRPARRSPPFARAGVLSLPPLLAPLALLAFAALALVLVYARPLEYTIVVGGAGECDATADFLGGEGDCAAAVHFHAPERNPAGVPFRWTRDRSTLVFHAAGLAFPGNRPLALELALADSRPAGVAPSRLRVQVNGVEVGQDPGSSGGNRAIFPFGGVGGGPVDARVTLLAEPFTPPGDPRQLGVAVLGPARLVEVSGPARSPLPALPPFGAWWRWLGLVLCGWGAALALSRRPWHAAAAGAVLVAGLTAVALVARVPFWEYMHLPLLLLAAALPLLWRRELARGTGGMVAAAARRGVRPPLLVALGLLVAAAAQAILSAGLGGGAPFVALVLYGVGIAVILGAVVSGGVIGAVTGETPGREVGGAPRTELGRGEPAALAGILVLAAGTRFYQLDDVPFGMWRDEARHGLEALRILREPGYRPVYIPNISLPGLYPALLAVVFQLAGEGIVALRGLTAAAGVGAVAALFVLTRHLWGARVALVAAFLGAVGSWRVSIDRLAFDTAPTTLCTLLALYAFVRGIDAVRAGGRGLVPFAAAGLAGGLAAWGYYPGRFALVGIVAAAILLLLSRGGRVLAPRLGPGLALALAVAVLTLLPLGRYAVERPDDFFRRSGQVYLLSPRYLEGQTAIEAVERNVARHLVMFNWRGEPNARHHAPNWPLLDAVTALCFAVGLALALLAAVRGSWAAGAMLLWLVVLLAPSVVSVDAPSAVRAQDAAPFAYALAALGFTALLHLLGGAGGPALLRRLVPTVAALALTFVVGMNLWLYFVHLPGDPQVLGKFYVGEARAGRAIAAAHEREPRLVAYLPRATPSLLADETLRFTADGTPLRELPPDGGALPPGPAMVVVPHGEDQREFERRLAAARRVAEPAGLREVRGEAPPGGGDPTYIAFVRE